MYMCFLFVMYIFLYNLYLWRFYYFFNFFLSVPLNRVTWSHVAIEMFLLLLQYIFTRRCGRGPDESVEDAGLQHPGPWSAEENSVGILDDCDHSSRWLHLLLRRSAENATGIVPLIFIFIWSTFLAQSKRFT